MESEKSPGEQREFEAIRVLRLEPGDTLVFRSQSTLSQETCVRIKGTLENQFPGHRVLVLESGCELDVLREAPAA